jgi:hypothetical protein
MIRATDQEDAMNQRPDQLAKRSSNVFINYRRDDSTGHAGRLFDRLSSRFPDRVFMDIDTIEPGIDFVDTIEHAVGCCEVLIVMIGRDWLFLTDATGRRRLENPSDFVRLEIALALERNIRVIPVLVEGAAMPRPEDLPPELARLTRRNAIELSEARWVFDVDRLIQTIEGVLQEKAPSALLPVVKAPAGPVRQEPAPAAREARPRAWMIAAVLVLLAVPGWLGWKLATEKSSAATVPEVRQPALEATAPPRESAAPATRPPKSVDVPRMEPRQPDPQPKKKGWLRSAVQRGRSALKNVRRHASRRPAPGPRSAGRP